MFENNNYKVNIYDIWACLYTFVIILLSMFLPTISFTTFGLLFLLALPFINCPEHYIGICFLFSTIAYYFHGALEGLYSIYTILVFLIFINSLRKRNTHINTKCLIPLIGLCITAVISFNQSQFNYSNGLFKLLYIIIVTTIIGNFYKIDIRKLSLVLPKIAGAMIIGYLLTVVISGSIVDGRLTISNTVNTNSFGMSCAQLATIMIVSYIISKTGKSIKLCLCIIVVLLAFLSGSRGALLAFMAASILIFLLKAKRSGHFTGKLMKLLLGVGILCAIISPLVSSVDVDLSRFNIKSIIDSGGSNRTLIYASVLQYVISGGYWMWGYGPGHYCSNRIIKSLIGWDYAHTHNTIIESFGELGIGGVVLTIMILIKSFANINRKTKNVKESYILYGMLICIFIHGMSESYFCNISFWLILAVCRNEFINCDVENEVLP